MRRWFAMLILSLGLSLAILPGCSEEQLSDVDKALADVNSVSEGLSDFARGPAGAVLPPMVRTLMELLGIGAAAALGVWKQIRHNVTKDALKAVVSGVESVSDGTNDVDEAAVKVVKDKVADAMKRVSAKKVTVTYAKLNAEVDKAKAKA